MNRLISDCRSERIDRIITKSISRFARNAEELLVTVRMLKEIGVSVYFEEQNLDTETLSAEVLLTIPGAVAQQESISISENMRWSYRKRMESGEFNCCTPAYGFCRADGELAIVEKEAETVRYIFELALQGLGRQNIANILTAEKIPTPRGRSVWSYGTVDHILRNRRYMGDALLQESYTTQSLPFKRKKNKGQLPKYYVKSSNPAIISKETFEAVQMLPKERCESSYAKRNRYIMSGVIYCPDCGKKFRHQKLSGKAYWICSSRASGKTNCRSIRLSEQKLEDTFMLLFHKLRENADELIKPLLANTEKLYKQNNSYADEVRMIDKEVADLAAKSHLVAQLYNKKMIGAEEYYQRSNALNEKILQLRRKRNRKLYDEKESRNLSELRQLADILEKSEESWEFNKEIFLEIVEKIQAESSEEVTFEILGGISLRERISE